MAYERYTEDPGDDLVRQLEQQQMQTQPVGAPTPMGAGYRPGSVDPRDADPATGYGPGGVENPAYTGAAGNPLGGANTGVAGGKGRDYPIASPGKMYDGPGLPPISMDMSPTKGGGLAPVAGGALARYGTADIEGAGDIKGGGYGGEGFSYNERAARGERGANTIKNTFGKIASRYDPTQAGAAKAVMADPDFQRFFPEAKLVEHPNGDLIDFGDGKPVDVLRAARAGGAGEAWQWGADEGGGGGGEMGGGGGLDMNSLIAGITSGNALGGIQSELDSLINGQDAESQTLIQKILSGEVQI